MSIYTRRCTNSAGAVDQEEHYYFHIQPLDIGWIDVWCDCYEGWKVKRVDNYEGETLENMTSYLSILLEEINNWIGKSDDSADYGFWEVVTSEGKDPENEIILYMVKQQLDILPDPVGWLDFNTDS